LLPIGTILSKGVNSMVSNSITIPRDIETVWNTIEAEFRKAFKCQGKELLGRRTTIKTRSYFGSPITVSQEVIEYAPREAIAIKSVNRDDVLISRYRLEALADDCCRVTLSVQGRNEKSKLKTWNYWVMSLPVFRSGARKRLAIQLQRLKEFILAGGDGP